MCVLPTSANGGHATLSGTSMAVPHTAGGAALYRATHPGASPTEVKAALLAAGGMDWTWPSEDGDDVKEPLPRLGSFRRTGVSARGLRDHPGRRKGHAAERSCGGQAVRCPGVRSEGHPRHGHPGTAASRHRVTAGTGLRRNDGTTERRNGDSAGAEDATGTRPGTGRGQGRGQGRGRGRTAAWGQRRGGAAGAGARRMPGGCPGIPPAGRAHGVGRRAS
ncbi:S8 family serine peptidase [Streptomyces spongiicola]|uniref:S8 family serine peptidase n=1 Tax=Streptomyces spongiicola TaxID=1690221 RepID=UPI001FE8DEF0|nr:S8 family serine peptidase [Streptomyces spongiicola]